MFEKEIVMQEVFFEKLKRQSSNSIFILEEFNGRFGNVDIVKVKLNNNKIKHYQAQLLSQPRFAYTVSLLHKNSPRTFEYIKNKTKNSSTTQNMIFKSLIEVNIVIEKEGKYFLDDNFVYPKIDFISYELKLKDWKKALTQAIKNLEFSSLSWVVLPKKICDALSDNTIDLYKSYNIGIISLTENGKTKIVLKAKANDSKNLKNYAYIVSMSKFIINQKVKA